MAPLVTGAVTIRPSPTGCPSISRKYQRDATQQLSRHSPGAVGKDRRVCTTKAATTSKVSINVAVGTPRNVLSNPNKSPVIRKLDHHNSTPLTFHPIPQPSFLDANLHPTPLPVSPTSHPFLASHKTFTLGRKKSTEITEDVNLDNDLGARTVIVRNRPWNAQSPEFERFMKRHKGKTAGFVRVFERILGIMAKLKVDIVEVKSRDIEAMIYDPLIYPITTERLVRALSGVGDHIKLLKQLRIKRLTPACAATKIQATFRMHVARGGAQAVVELPEVSAHTLEVNTGRCRVAELFANEIQESKRVTEFEKVHTRKCSRLMDRLHRDWDEVMSRRRVLVVMGSASRPNDPTTDDDLNIGRFSMLLDPQVDMILVVPQFDEDALEYYERLLDYGFPDNNPIDTDRLKIVECETGKYYSFTRRCHHNSSYSTHLSASSIATHTKSHTPTPKLPNSSPQGSLVTNKQKQGSSFRIASYPSVASMLLTSVKALKAIQELLESWGKRQDQGQDQGQGEEPAQELDQGHLQGQPSGPAEVGQSPASVKSSDAGPAAGSKSAVVGTTSPPKTAAPVMSLLVVDRIGQAEVTLSSMLGSPIFGMAQDTWIKHVAVPLSVENMLRDAGMVVAPVIYLQGPALVPTLRNHAKVYPEIRRWHLVPVSHAEAVTADGKLKGLEGWL
ncbi:hypothetical protein HK102_006743, partial [Quaeritorhiza haematococci]